MGAGRVGKDAMRRRAVLHALAALAAGLGGTSRAGAQGGGERWLPIEDDDGKPIPNLKLPVELTSEVDELRGLFRMGADNPDVSVIEFYDYNCPFCRKAAPELERLAESDKQLQIGLVNNPILSPASKDAARHELAVLKLAGSEMAAQFHRRLFQRRGPIDGAKALAVAQELGFGSEAIAEQVRAPDVNEALAHQLRLAASMGLSATPSFLIAGAGVLGYPGIGSLTRMIASVRRCDLIAC